MKASNGTLALQKAHSLPNLPGNGPRDRGAMSSTFVSGGKGMMTGSPKRDPLMPEALATISLTRQELKFSSTFTSGAVMAKAANVSATEWWGPGPPPAGAWKVVYPSRKLFVPFDSFEGTDQPATQFRRFFERHDLPIAVRLGVARCVDWKVEPDKLDYVYHLPIFFEGLLEKVHPYNFLAYQGLQDMINAARGKEPSLLVPAVPALIVPLKRCLKTKDISIMCKAINMLQLMIKSDPLVGAVLVPYYRQILPIFNLFRGSNLNLGDKIEYSQRKRENMGDMVAETLDLMERTGGEDAFINIKYMIPTYESCMV